MYDNFKVEYSQKFILKDIVSSEPFDAFGYKFHPQCNPSGKYLYHRTSIENELMIKIWKDGRMTIENSLHKFWKGNNYSDFILSEIRQSIEKIEDVLHLPSEGFILRSLETAINFETLLPFHLLLSSYRKNPFDLLRSSKTIYGKKCYMTDYNLKGYNKFLEVSLNSHSTFEDRLNVTKNLNRFEIDYKRMRGLNSKNIIYLSDLTKSSSLISLGEGLLNFFDQIEMNKNYDYNILTSRERELFFAGKDPAFWEVEKMNKNTRKKKMAKYSQLKKKLENALEKDPQQEIRKLIKDKIDFLLSN
ncbi:hypothetical protein FE904_18310 [Chryseobacterium indologenes]|uniref:hypothetical protein n=1 Tax=Chryseobacterium indologenes TaxID=253 RepID=UPI00076E3C7E|nr:hypothetical protein [Chryseobacterium indologenes]TLX24044.1 hypothetical protein FE904_18310 [Chryseobacterium indologenes]